MTANLPADARVVERRTTMPATADEVWQWHARPGAFERLAPPWEPVTVLARSGPLAEGATVTLRVHAGPVPMRWTARHYDVEPGRGFSDEQIDGPFRAWVHRHAMIPDIGDTSTMVDTIRYVPPLGPLGDLAGDIWLDGRLASLLRYRHDLLAADLAAHARARADGMHAWRIAITGARGLIGSQLVPFLTTGGHTVRRLVRGQAGGGDVAWDPARGQLEASALDGFDAVVHLAGENVGAGRWTPERKTAIRESRVRGTTLLAETLARLPRPPRVLVAASAVGIYGDRGDEVLDEHAAPGRGFLAEVGEAWERSADAARAAGIRVVHLRFGVILSPAGGALARMLPPFRLGLGGPIGSGRQWFPWASLDDAVGMIHHALHRPTLQGAVNAVAPEAVTNATFTAALGRALHRPAFLPIPAAALRLLFGEMADAALLASQCVTPRALEADGYPFRHPTLAAALAHVLGAQPS
jgi:uncharacterized protein (TIGR01777 family)